MRSSVALALALALAAVGGGAATARADNANGCPTSDCCCAVGTPNAHAPVSCSATSDEVRGVCWGDASSGGGQTAPINPAVIEGLGTIAFVLILPLAPAHVVQLFGSLGSVEVSTREWNAYAAQLRELQAKGRAIGKAARALRDAERDAPDERRAANAKLRAQPIAAPKLVPSLAYRCDRVLVVAWYRDGWPLEGFDSLHDYQTKCPGDPGVAARAPAGDPTSCDAGDVLCAGTDAACCPTAQPVYNPCDRACYRTSDFRAAATEDGLRCRRYTSCGASVR